MASQGFWYELEQERTSYHRKTCDLRHNYAFCAPCSCTRPHDFTSFTTNLPSPSLFPLARLLPITPLWGYWIDIGGDGMRGETLVKGPARLVMCAGGATAASHPSVAFSLSQRELDGFLLLLGVPTLGRGIRGLGPLGTANARAGDAHGLSTLTDHPPSHMREPEGGFPITLSRVSPYSQSFPQHPGRGGLLSQLFQLLAPFPRRTTHHLPRSKRETEAVLPDRCWGDYQRDLAQTG
ncbi:LOW QUALITY PROTEIN: hypothetical protein CVT26_010177 [Gymnopilus dilepis]|uniref:Uncharacterized protein n=1 Tax=Gymnopilus dilepis TaxID=231916 RepID=A0A409WCW5_9AGAR|nr:LOW QUALITY PROTEIN: hypothetical protein CVT26_010177 [Gymnopilus dilepis]